jgi:hypothetical protein
MKVQMFITESYENAGFTWQHFEIIEAIGSPLVVAKEIAEQHADLHSLCLDEEAALQTYSIVSAEILTTPSGIVVEERIL